MSKSNRNMEAIVEALRRSTDLDKPVITESECAESAKFGAFAGSLAGSVVGILVILSVLWVWQ